MGRLLTRLVAFLVAAGLLAAIAGVVLLTLFLRPGERSEAVTLNFPAGTSSTAIAQALAREDVVAHPLIFRLGWRLYGGASPLQAGEYRFAPEASAYDAMRKLQTGDVLVRQVTIPEGFAVAQVMARLAAAPGLAPPTLEPVEGSLLPDTYNYRRGDGADSLIRRMQAAQESFLDDIMAEAPSDWPLDGRRDVVTLASIVERETARSAEKPRVAAVFLNRLARGMRLQADATVVYALTKGREPLGRELLRTDWEIDSPYNTYRYDGLPPTPIANPGREALRAAVNPADTDDLYFVADGRGGHVFAETLAEHNRNVAAYRDRDNSLTADPPRPKPAP